MKHVLLTALVLMILTGFAYGEDKEKTDNLHGPDQSVAVEMGYKTMANGGVVYEEVEPAGQSAENQALEDIAPAAGPNPSGTVKLEPSSAPSFRYDPLTQTYRRVTVDKNGNTRHDVINTAR